MKAVVYGIRWDIDMKEYPDLYRNFIKEKMKAEKMFSEGKADEEALIKHLLEDGELEAEEDYDRDYTTFGEYFNEDKVRAEFYERYLNLPQTSVVDIPMEYDADNEASLTKEDVLKGLKAKYGDYKILPGFEYTSAKGHGNDIARQKIKDTVNTMLERNDFQEFLKLTRNFDSYSLNNKLLVYGQKPDATIVKGAGVWREQYGRNVSSGSHGIWIYRPNKRTFPSYTDPEKVREWVDSHNSFSRKVLGGMNIITESELERQLKNLAEGKSASFVSSMGVTVVYDVSDTYGKELPKVEDRITDSGHGQALLEAFCRNIGAEGCIRDNIPDMSLSLADYLLHGETVKVPLISKDMKLNDHRKKLEAGAVAYLISDRFGCDASSKLTDIAKAFEDDPAGVRGTLFLELLERIDRTVTYVSRECDKLEKELGLSAEEEEEEEMER